MRDFRQLRHIIANVRFALLDDVRQSELVQVLADIALHLVPQCLSIALHYVYLLATL